MSPQLQTLWNETRLIKEGWKRALPTNDAVYSFPRIQRKGLPNGPHEELLKVELTIASLKQELCSLRQRRRELLVELSPVSSIPDEMLAQIFQYVVADDPAAINDILWVCKRWKRVAYFNPSLWTTIKFDRYNNLPTFLDMIDAYCGRSAALNLEIHFDMAYCSTLSDVDGIFRHLIPHLRRCTTFNVSALSWEWLSYSMHCWDVLKGSLRHATLRIYDQYPEDITVTPLLTGTFSLLSTLTLIRVPLRTITADMPNLTILDIYSVRSCQSVNESLVRIISSSKSLSDVRIGAVWSIEDAALDLDDGIQSKTANVSSITLDRISSDAICRFLRRIKFPNLKSLMFRPSSCSRNGGGVHWLDDLASQQAEKCAIPNFRHLELHDVQIGEVEIKQLRVYFSRIPQLEELALSSIAGNLSITHSFFWQLSNWSNEGILPNLQAMWIKECGNIYRILLDLIYCRKNTANVMKPIQSLRITDIAIPVPIAQKLKDSVKHFEFEEVDIQY